MTEVIASGLLALGLTGIAVCLYGLARNRQTYRQVMAIIPSPDDPEFWEKIEALDAVTYDQHFWALFFFRDPYALYPEAISGRHQNLD